MSAVNDSRTVSTTLIGIIEGREKSIRASAGAHLGATLKAFHERQPSGQGVEGEFWNNKTSEAANAVFGETYRTKTEIGFFLAHGMDYGIYLELANNRQNEVLRPLIEEFGAKFLKSVGMIMSK